MIRAAKRVITVSARSENISRIEASGVSGGTPARLQQHCEPFINGGRGSREGQRQGAWLTPEEALRRYLRKEIAITGAPVAAGSILRTGSNRDQAPPQSEAGQGEM